MCARQALGTQDGLHTSCKIPLWGTQWAHPTLGTLGGSSLPPSHLPESGPIRAPQGRARKSKLGAAGDSTHAQNALMFTCDTGSISQQGNSEIRGNDFRFRIFSTVLKSIHQTPQRVEREASQNKEQVLRFSVLDNPSCSSNNGLHVFILHWVLKIRS